jgi:putative glutamine amidotransferase
LIEGELEDKDLFKNNILSNQFKNIVKNTNGLFFLGGADFPPTIYGEKTSLSFHQILWQKIGNLF